jgi:hypothetical protein
MKIYCRHNNPHVILVSDLVRQTLQDNQMSLWPETLQVASSMVCGWLLGADTNSFGCDHLTEVLQSLPKFENLPVACRRRILKTDIIEVIADKKTATQGIVILCDGDFLTETNIAMEATLNRSSPKAIAECPDGLNFKYIEYYAEVKSKSPNHKQAVPTIKARAKQAKWMVLTRRVRIDGIQGIDFAIMLPNPAINSGIPTTGHTYHPSPNHNEPEMPIKLQIPHLQPNPRTTRQIDHGSLSQRPTLGSNDGLRSPTSTLKRKTRNQNRDVVHPTNERQHKRLLLL